MSRHCFVENYCFERITGSLLIYKNNILISKYTQGNVPKNLKRIFNNFNMRDIEKYVVEIVPKANL